MFLYRLDEEQREAFMSLAQAFIEADDRLHPEEERVLKLMRREMDLDPSGSGEGASVDLNEESIGSVFDDREAQVTVLLELLGLGYADDDFAPEENQFIRKLSDVFDVTSARLEQMENWVLRQVALVQDAESMIESG